MMCSEDDGERRKSRLRDEVVRLMRSETLVLGFTCS